MACIPHLLKLKGNRNDFKINSVAILESGGNYKEFDFCVTFTHKGNRCGYIAVPSTHPIFKNYKGDYNIPLDVHGGVSFCDSPQRIVNDKFLSNHSCGDIWIGFDAGHCFDAYDIELALKIFPERQNELSHWAKSVKMMSSFGDIEIRQNDYMENECKNMIDQLLEKFPPLITIADKPRISCEKNTQNKKNI
jgi:hypothetical protein